MKPGPTPRDWLLLAVSLAFVAMGALLVAVGRARRENVAGLVFFAGCAAVGVWTILRKREMSASASALRVDVLGGVPIPMKRSTPAIMGAALLLVGVTMIWGYRQMPIHVLACCVVMAAAGATLLALLALGRVGGGTLTFEPEGLRIASAKGSFVVHWSNVASAHAAEHYRNPAVLIRVRDVAMLVSSATGADVGAARASVAKAVHKNRTWAACDVLVSPFLFGIDPVLFAKLVAKYAEKPERRGELAARRGLPGAT
jgi:hypothetical protein